MPTGTDRKRKAADEAFQRKEANREVIKDTLKQCKSDPELRRVNRTHRCSLPGHVSREPCEDLPAGTGGVRVEIRNEDCVSVAKEYCKISGAKVWILNMASASNGGGGVMRGCNAQEEHLCRCSNLLPHLQQASVEGHYPLHTWHRHGSIPDFSVLVHKAIEFFKRPSDYATLPRAERFKVGVLTAAAEKVRDRVLGPNAERFIDFMLDTALMQGCTHLVLSAWGCGAFGQCPHEVAECFRRTFAKLQLTHNNLQVAFAILDDHNSDDNLVAFQRVFQLGIRPGDWFITHGCVDSYGKRSKNVCKEYDRPPPNGNYVQTFDPNTYIGPVIAVEQRGSFTTITVPGMVQAHGFINVAKHTHRFATLICHEEIKRWKSQGWEQPVWPCPVVE